LGNADRFHGAWPHWINGNDGKIPFGTKDNGGFSRNLIPLPGIADRQGISKRNYHRAGNLQQPKQMPFGKAWNGIGTQKCFILALVTYHGWEMNFKLEGYNRCLITYVMGASPTHPIPAAAYHQGWASVGNSKWWVITWHSRNFQLQRSFRKCWAFVLGNILTGLDPSHLTDQYADYWALTQNHSKIIKILHCKSKTMEGYSDKCWGLTASYSPNSDGSTGYSAHQPNNDLGVITYGLVLFPLYASGINEISSLFV
jgi:hypothetical protein